jgi:hypothetical protein
MVPGTVCISLVAYEDVQWIQALLDNIRAYTDAPVALHLNALSRYDASQLRQWDSSRNRVFLTDSRIAVFRNKGSILYAHVLNVRLLARRWPSCQHVVMQASNMLWLRHGMEAHVVSREYSLGFRNAGSHRETAAHVNGSALYRALIDPLPPCDASSDPWRPSHGYCSSRQPISQHEGSFYPLGAFLSFEAFLRRFLDATGASLGDTLIRAFPWPEESFLQAFVQNHYAPYREWAKNSSGHGCELCWRAPHAPHPLQTDATVAASIRAGKMACFYAMKVVRGAHRDNVTARLLLPETVNGNPRLSRRRER